MKNEVGKRRDLSARTREYALRIIKLYSALLAGLVQESNELIAILVTGVKTLKAGRSVR